MRGVIGKWGRDRERAWQRGHRDSLAVAAGMTMDIWLRTLTPQPRRQIGEPTRQERAAADIKRERRSRRRAAR